MNVTREVKSNLEGVIGVFVNISLRNMLVFKRYFYLHYQINHAALETWRKQIFVRWSWLSFFFDITEENFNGEWKFAAVSDKER